MHTTRMMLRSQGLALILAFASTLSARADTPRVPPEFTANYAVSYRGIQAGNLTFALQRAEDGRYIYETKADPSFLARLVVSSNALERSEMIIDENGVRPLEWSLDDGKSGSKGDGHLTFDWEAGRVTGFAEEQKIDLPTVPGLQDRLSIQIAVTTSLLRGEEPGTIPLIDDERVKHYTYRRVGTEVIDTPLGSFDTAIYESAREGSSRLSRFWMAPKLGYLPVRAEQIRKGKVETVMQIRAFERAE